MIKIVLIARQDIERLKVDYLRKGEKPWQPDLYLVRCGSREAVLKDYAKKKFVYRFFIGVLAIYRETYIYEKLEGLPGIPAFIGKVDRYAIIVEYIKGKDASRCKKGELPPLFFARLREIIDMVHGRGIVLCDMRNNKNILVTEDQSPYLIDFSTAFERGFRINILRNFIFNIFYQDDLLGIAKLKGQIAPQLLTSEEEEKLEKGLFLQREAIFVRNHLRSILRRLAGS